MQNTRVSQNIEGQKNENSISNLLYRVFVGILFGFANVIPGVSGGTVMVVLGVYERIIAILTDFRRKIKTEWKFFLPIIIGMGIAILLFGRLMSDLLDRHKEITQMFFIGVIIFSVPQIFKAASHDKSKKLNIKPVHIIVFALVLALMIFMATSDANEEKARIKNAKEQTEQAVQDGEQAAEAESAPEEDSYNPDHRFFALLLLVVYGAIGSSTMIIPGISGSLVMVMLGQYENIMHAIKHFDILVLAPFGVGCLLGIVFCSRLIKWLLTHHSQLTYCAILGFVIGSILPVFPGWKAGFSVAGIVAFLIGGACIVGCELLSRKYSNKEALA